MTVLTKQEIADLGLVVNPARDALQPCGVDLTVHDIGSYTSPGGIYRDKKPYLSYKSLPSNYGVWHLSPGSYHVSYAEEINLPVDVCAFVYPRSSLIRSGCMIYTAVWDPGYHGLGAGQLMVNNPSGLYLERGARIAQVVFHRLSSSTVAYAGQYQGERTTRELLTEMTQDSEAEALYQLIRDSVFEQRRYELFDPASGYKETEE